MAAMSARTHYSKPYLAQLETGQREISADHLSAYADALGLDFDRLASVAKRSVRVDERTLRDVASILSATRRLEDSIGALAVLPSILSHSAMVETLTKEAPSELAEQCSTLVSELFQYQGWLELNIGHVARSDRSLDRAIVFARGSGDPDRLSHGLSFKAYAALEYDKLEEASALTDAALEVDGTHPRLRTFDLYQRAQIHASSREYRQARAVLRKADRAAERGSSSDLPDAGYWYTDALWSLERGRTLWLLGDKHAGAREVSTGLAEMPPEHREAEWANKWVRLAAEVNAPGPGDGDRGR